MKAAGTTTSPTRLMERGGQPTLLLQSALVRVVGGPDVGASCPLHLARLRVGTAEDCDLPLRDHHVSRYHLEFRVHDEGFYVQDLGSTNGTFYRGLRIHNALLRAGTELQLGETRLRLEPSEALERTLVPQAAFGQLVGTSAAMQRMYGVLEAVAPTEATILIEGETGTGKELVAESIHQHSPRAARPLVVVDCGAMPAALIESELFGHERGAFTGAASLHLGVLERADGSTVFLDEIGELPLALQTRLLRVLEKRTIRRVGSSFERRVDLRFVAATNRDLLEDVRAGTFRQDLYHRLAVIRIQVPPLRERLEDIAQLTRHFLWKAGCPNPDEVFNAEVWTALRRRRWEGNVRELANVVERAVLLAEPPRLDGQEPAGRADPAPDERGPEDPTWLDCLPSALYQLPYKEAKRLLVDHFERGYLQRLQQQHGANIWRMAKSAAIDRHMVRKLLHKHRVEGEDEGPDAAESEDEQRQ